MFHPSALDAVRLGLLKFPHDGQVWPGRRGGAMQYVLDSRGAGTNLPLRTLIVQRLAEKLKDFDTAEVIGGVSKSGVIWGAWLAREEELEFATVLPDGPRPFGLQRTVEGDVAGKRMVLVDNWTRTGESLRDAINQAQNASATIIGALVIARPETVQVDIPLVAAWTLYELLEAACMLSLIDETQLEALKGA